MSDKEKFKLRAEPKQAIHVNKPVVIAIGAVLGFAILFAIIHAFSPAKEVKTTGKIKAVTDKSVTFNKVLDDLPGSYSDVDGIKKYSFGGDTGDMTRLQSQLDQMQNSYSALEKQMRLLSQSGQEKPVVKNPRDEQAKASGLLFSNVSSDTQSVVGKGAGNILGGSTKGGIGGKNADKYADISVTPEQQKYFEQQADDIQKKAVMAAAVDHNNPDLTNDLAPLVQPPSKYLIQAGTVIPAVLITGINTTWPGTVVAQVRRNIYDTVTGNYLLVPMGSKLIGEYRSNVRYGDKRVLLTFNRVIRPDGSSAVLDKVFGADLQGHSGVEGSVNNHWARILGAATVSTLLSVGAGAASNSYSKKDESNAAQNAILGGAKGISDVGNQLTSKAMNIQPTITLPAGYQFNVIIKKDKVLRPYKGRR